MKNIYKVFILLILTILFNSIIYTYIKREGLENMCEDGEVWSTQQQSCVKGGGTVKDEPSFYTMQQSMYSGIGPQYHTTPIPQGEQPQTVMAGGANTLKGGGGGVGVCLSVAPTLIKVGNWDNSLLRLDASGLEMPDVSGNMDMSFNFDISKNPMDAYGGGLAGIPPIQFQTPPSKPQDVSANDKLNSWMVGTAGTEGTDSYGVPITGYGSQNGGMNPDRPTFYT